MDQNLAQGASQNLEQTHILSPQHLQALKALQAPVMELSGSFADVLAENPLITTEDDEAEYGDEVPEQDADYEDGQEPRLDDAPVESMDENRLDYDEELARILEGDDDWASVRQEDGGDAPDSEAEKRREYMFNSVAQEVSLQALPSSACMHRSPAFAQYTQSSLSVTNALLITIPTTSSLS